MNRKKLMLCSAVAMLSMACQFAGIAAGPDAKADAVKVQVATDRQDALYKCGEKVTFKGTVTKDGKPVTAGKVTIRLSNDNLKTVAVQEIDLSQNNPFVVERTMTDPGFLQCAAVLENAKGLAGAGFDPEKIQPAANLPEDFKKFWDDSIQEADKIPLDIKLEPLPKSSSPQFDCFKISFANIDNTRIYGFLSVPKDRKGPFPALVTVPGAGPSRSFPDINWVKNGVIVLVMNVHQYDPPADSKENRKIYEALNKPLLYSLHDVPDRDKYYFKKSILGINRAINWLAARPDVDKTHFAMFGSSQGGAFTLIMSGLNKNITAGAANVPALCDHASFLMNRNPGWPQLLMRQGPEKVDPAAQKMSGYFDAINFARNITCPMIVSVGFIDSTCSPSSVYAAYNTIRSPKMIFNEPTMGHSQSKGFTAYQNEWLKGKLGIVKETAPLKK